MFIKMNQFYAHEGLVDSVGDVADRIPGDNPNESTPSVVSKDPEETRENEAIVEQPSKLIPRSRMEKSLAKIAGDPDVADFKPKSRKERFLDNIAENGTPSGGGASMTSITYAELVALRNAGNLTPGAQYRITDYVCTVANDAEAQAVSHPYDIIVTADDKTTLNENARACLHEGDTYYSAEGAQADLTAWELKYCLDNDTRRFAWADSANGKGVVFWLKDDWNNECPYDFKQIQFKRYKITDCDKSPNLVDTYLAASEVSADITKDPADFIWAYTFSGVLNESIIDTSVYNWAYLGKEGYLHCYDNAIKTFAAAGGANRLNNIVFLASEIPCWSNTFGNNCWSNTFGNDCWSNTFGNDCRSNTFGNNCRSNTFGNNCWYNTFGNNCWSNTFGNNCWSNTFGNDCWSNTFGNDCWYNTFGNDCWYNTFGNDCRYNTFGNDCRSNTFGNDCRSNTFGNDCWSNTFGNNCWSNTFGNNCWYNTFGNDAQGDEASAYCRWCTFEDGVKGVVLSNDTATNANQIQNYHVLNGTQGVIKTGIIPDGQSPVQTPITVNASLGLSYCTYVGKNSSGVVKTWAPADLVQS